MPNLQAKYRRISAVLNWLAILMGCAIVVLVMYKSRSAFGLPMGRASLEGIRLKFLAWLAICLVSIPLGFCLSKVISYGAFGLLMTCVGKITLEEAKRFALYGSYPNAWSEHSTHEAFKPVRAAGSDNWRGAMNKALIAGLISDNEEAVAEFGESDTCIVVDWRDGAEEIFKAVMPFLPQGYLRFEKRGSTRWAIQTGGRPSRIVEFSQHTKHEEFFVELNQMLAPDFELWQYTPNDGDGYSLFLAPSEWWQSFAAEHPAVLAKYFLSANRLAAYWRKSYLARLFSKP